MAPEGSGARASTGYARGWCGQRRARHHALAAARRNSPRLHDKEFALRAARNEKTLLA